MHGHVRPIGRLEELFLVIVEPSVEADVLDAVEHRGRFLVLVVLFDRVPLLADVSASVGLGDERGGAAEPTEYEQRLVCFDRQVGFFDEAPRHVLSSRGSCPR